MGLWSSIKKEVGRVGDSIGKETERLIEPVKFLSDAKDIATSDAVSDLTGGNGPMDVVGKIEDFVKDPLGNISDAEKAAARIAELQKTSAGRNILLQEQQLAQVAGLTQPFREAGTDVALPMLSALALGGEVDYQPSELLGRRLASGREGILKNRAARAGIKSSRTFEDLADLASTLSAEDLGRFEQGNINLLNTGLRAEDVLRQSVTSTAGSVGGIFGNLGQSLTTAQQNTGAAQLANANTIGGGVSSLASLALLA